MVYDSYCPKICSRIKLLSACFLKQAKRQKNKMIAGALFDWTLSKNIVAVFLRHHVGTVSDMLICQVERIAFCSMHFAIYL